MKNKFFAFLLAVLLLLSIPNCAYAGEFVNDDAQQLSEQSKAVEQLQEFLNNFDDCAYGGAYIGANNQLVIKLVSNDDEQLKYIKKVNLRENFFSKNKIDIEYANYSLDYLKKVVDQITPHLGEWGLLGVGIDEENNCIVIDAADNDKSNVRKNLLNYIDLPESKSIKDENLFVINETDLMIQNTATINPGAKVKKLTVLLLLLGGCYRTFRNQ